MEKEENFNQFKEFIEQNDKYIKTNNIEEIQKIYPLINNYEEIFLRGYHKRKSEGAFYTNKEISDFMVAETLICLLNKNIDLTDQKIIKLQSLEDIFRLDLNFKNNITQLLLNTTICDPACGSGGFLLSAADILYKTLIKLNCELSKIQIKNQILVNLYGFDINKYAITLCLLKLLKWFNSEPKIRMKQIISILKSNLQIQNSIITSKFPKFDIIIGNPPYGNILNQEEKEILEKENIFFKDIYCTFLKKSLAWSNEFVGFLVPKSFLLRQGYIKFRNDFFSNANILKIYDIGSKIFKRVTNEVQILIYENQKNLPKQDLAVYDYPKTKIITYSDQDVDSLRVCFNINCPLCLKSKKLYVYTFDHKCPYCNSNTKELNRIRIKPRRKILQILEKLEKTGDLNYLNPVDYPRMIRGEEENGLREVKRKLKKDTTGSCFFISARNDFNY
ncbi:MAG: class I SAM-dependent DNA methyltransferase, partial [Candidatus Hermodarchaeota archaeon]